MQTHLEHTCLFVQQKWLPMEKPSRGRTSILTDSARTRNRKGVLANYNKTRIKIGYQYDRWVELCM